VQLTTKMFLAEDDYVVEEVPPDGPDHALGVGVLPWRTRGGEDFGDAHGFRASSKSVAIDDIAIAEEVPGSRVLRERLEHLLSCPGRGRCAGHVEVDYLAPMVKQHDEHEEDTERRGGTTKKSPRRGRRRDWRGRSSTTARAARRDVCVRSLGICRAIAARLLRGPRSARHPSKVAFHPTGQGHRLRPRRTPTHASFCASPPTSISPESPGAARTRPAESATTRRRQRKVLRGGSASSPSRSGEMIRGKSSGCKSPGRRTAGRREWLRSTACSRRIRPQRHTGWRRPRLAVDLERPIRAGGTSLAKLYALDGPPRVRRRWRRQ
jgi:hypothetical protein